MQVNILSIDRGTYFDPSGPYYRLYHHPPPEPAEPSSILVHVEIFHHQITHVSEIPYDDEDYNPGTVYEERKGLCFWCEIGLFSNGQESVFNFLSPKFASLGIPSYYFQSLADLLSQDVINISPDIFAFERRIAFPVVCEIRTEWLVNYSEWVILDFLDEILMESMEEYEMGNNGMIPAAAESLDMLKKSVKVEEKGNCTVCLEDLGEFASAMPCKHMFHDECIVTWLKQSHYCPVCRFELPADVAET